MFGKKTKEEEIIIEADKIASSKENFDALSWNRVSEIATAFLNDIDPDTMHELARELLAISHANTDLLGKLGISEGSFSGKVMPSGIEMFEKGIAIDAKLPIPTVKKEKIDHPLPATTKKAHNLVPDLDDELTSFFSAPFDDDSFIPRGVPVVENPEPKPIKAAPAPKPIDSRLEIPTPKSVDVTRENPAPKSVDLTPEIVMNVVSQGDVAIEPEVLNALLKELETTNVKQDQIPAPVPEPEKPRKEKIVDSSVPTTVTAEKKKTPPSVPVEKKREGITGHPRVSKQDLARFTQIYSSKDGSLCLYRDGDGHIVAVDASKLA